LALSGAAYQAIEAREDARRSPEAGRLADIGGYRLKLNCTGSGHDIPNERPDAIVSAVGDLCGMLNDTSQTNL